jgi:hypothetical protein
LLNKLFMTEEKMPRIFAQECRYFPSGVDT